MCSLRSLTCLQVQVLPRQGMVGPSSHSRLWLGETATGASSAVNRWASRWRKLPARTGQPLWRESEANGPQRQRPARVSRGRPSWTEFVRLADQAVVAIAGAEMINPAEPWVRGHSRGSRRLDPEPETERTAGPASDVAGDGCGSAQDDQAGIQPYWGKPAVRNDERGRRNRRYDLMAICHDARKGRHSGSHWSKPAHLRSTRPVTCGVAGWLGQPRDDCWKLYLVIAGHGLRLTPAPYLRRMRENSGR
jgi:hypothetical protein